MVRSIDVRKVAITLRNSYPLKFYSIFFVSMITLIEHLEVLPQRSTCVEFFFKPYILRSNIYFTIFLHDLSDAWLFR